MLAGELQRLSAFQQVRTKVPPAYDGRSSWFAYEDAIDGWVDITKLETVKQGSSDPEAWNASLTATN